jgi:prophage maintenance system killer protein
MVTPCGIFEKDYKSLYRIIIKEYEDETKEKIKAYKDYEPDLLVTFCKKYSNEKDILDQAANLLSGLIILQALPNANHRTAFRFVSIYLLRTSGLKMKTYNEAKALYDGFYSKSKPILEFEINHEALFKEDYMDSHHSMGIEKHLKHSKELLEKIVPAQSGMVEAVPFQRFISSLNHSS